MLSAIDQLEAHAKPLLENTSGRQRRLPAQWPMLWASWPLIFATLLSQSSPRASSIYADGDEESDSGLDNVRRQLDEQSFGLNDKVVV